MKRLLATLTIGAMLTGCTGDMKVLVGDVGDHLTHDILNSVFGFLFPSDEEAPATEEGGAVTGEEGQTTGP